MKQKGKEEVMKNELTCAGSGEAVAKQRSIFKDTGGNTSVSPSRYQSIKESKMIYCIILRLSTSNKQ